MTSPRVTIRGNGDQSQVLRWLLRATADDSRPVLEGIHLTDGWAIATDGRRLFAVQADELGEVMAPAAECQAKNEAADDGRSIASWRTDKIPAGEFVADLEAVEGTFPDVNRVIPRGREHKAQVTLNVDFLADLAKYGAHGQVTLLIGEPSEPVEVLYRTDDGHKRYALIMPMHLDRDLNLDKTHPRPWSLVMDVDEAHAEADRLYKARTGADDEADEPHPADVGNGDKPAGEPKPTGRLALAAEMAEAEAPDRSLSPERVATDDAAGDVWADAA